VSVDNKFFIQGGLGDGDLMLICITPDHEGKFGFNVKVGLSRTHHRCKLSCVIIYLIDFFIEILTGWSGSKDASVHIPR